MRAHLVKCFDREKLSAFPREKGVDVRRADFQFISVVVYCPCKRPDSFDEMIQCDRCDAWYHFKCANIKEDPLCDWFRLLCP